MRTLSRFAVIAFISLFAVPVFAADPCLLPPQRMQKPLLDNASLDDELALAMEAASNACLPVSEVCEQLKLSCTTKLQQANAAQTATDMRAYVVDMQTLYLGQRFPIGVLRPMVSDGLSNCSLSVEQLKAAMGKRREMAGIRRELAKEYDRWSRWLVSVQQRCRGGALPAAPVAVAVPVSAGAAPADAGTVAPSTSAAGAAVVAGAVGATVTLDAQRRAQDEAAKAAAQKAALEQQQRAEEDRRVKAEADERARRELAEVDAKRQQEALAQSQAAAALAQSRADDEKKKGEQAAAHAAALEADRQDRAEAERVVNEREDRKEAARKRVEALRQAEEERRRKVQADRETARREAQEEHERRRDEHTRNWELSDEQRKLKLAAEDARFEEEERVRREKADREIAEAGEFDRSDERLGGAVAALGVGGYVNLANSRARVSGLLLGAEISFRVGIWTLAPAAGLASGFEIRAAGSYLTTVGAAGGSVSVLGGTPELRVFWGRLGFGIALSVQQIDSDLSLDTPRLATKVTATALGPTFTLAVVDDRNVRVLASVRWLPAFASLDNVEGELEAGFAAFSMHVRAGKQRGLGDDGTFSRHGYFVVAGIGGRLRW